MIYFDHASAMTVLPEIIASYPDYLRNCAGNPEAAHGLGRGLRQKISGLEKAVIAAVFPDRYLNESAVFTAADASLLLEAVAVIAAPQRGGVAWGSDLEHIADTLALRRHFERVEKMPLDNIGRISACPAGKADLVVITHVQSEIGVRQDLPDLIGSIRQQTPQAIILVDAVQSAAWESYPVQAPLPDLLLISGAKLGAGNGAALIASGPGTGKFRDGFKQLRTREHRISKTDPVSLSALADALTLHRRHHAEENKQIGLINAFLREKLAGYTLPNGKKLILTVPAESAANNILHLLLPGYQSGVLVRMFSAENIMLSAGSACQSETDEPSLILQALNFSKTDAFSGLRLSFSAENTLEEAGQFLLTMDKILRNY